MIFFLSVSKFIGLNAIYSSDYAKNFCKSALLPLKTSGSLIFRGLLKRFAAAVVPAAWYAASAD